MGHSMQSRAEGARRESQPSIARTCSMSESSPHESVCHGRGRRPIDPIDFEHLMGINPRAVRRAQPAMMWIGVINCLAGMAFLGDRANQWVGGVVLLVGLSVIASTWRARRRSAPICRDVKSAINGRLLCALATSLVAVACQQRLQGTICNSLVLTSSSVVEREAVCILPEDRRPTDLLADSVFGAVGPGMTLGGRLASLGSPRTRKQDDGIEWYVFDEPGRTLEAACVPARSVDEDDDDLCFWRLRSHPRSAEGQMRPELQTIVERITEAGMQDGALALVGPQRKNGSQESVSVAIRNGMVQSFDWYDPTGTKDFSRHWRNSMPLTPQN